MQIKFKSVQARLEFSSMGRANQAIAEYMKDAPHEAVNCFNGTIELVDGNGEEIILNDDGTINDTNNGWGAFVFMSERNYFDIEGE